MDNRTADANKRSGRERPRAQPTRQPEAVTTSFISDDDALVGRKVRMPKRAKMAFIWFTIRVCSVTRAASLAGFVTPTMQELEQPLLLGIELLKGLAFD